MEDIEGAGWKDFTKIIRDIKHKLNAGATNVKDRMLGFITGKRDDYQPKVRQILSEYRNTNVISITVRRDSLNKAVDAAVNTITLNKFNQSKQQAGYDTYFHLYIIVELDNGIKLKIEKNEVINIELYWNYPNINDHYVVNMSNPINLITMLDNTKNGMGIDKYFYYDPIYNNCQNFIYSIMKYNNLLDNNHGLEQFILQDMSTLMNNLSDTNQKIMKHVTDIARRFNILTRGKGFRKINKNKKS